MTAPEHSGASVPAACCPERQPRGRLLRGAGLARQNEALDPDGPQPSLDGASTRGIAIILGTPPFAPPPRMQRLHTESITEACSIVATGWGRRQDMGPKPAGPSVVRATQEPQGDRPPGLPLPRNDRTFEAFVAWPRARHRIMKGPATVPERIDARINGSLNTIPSSNTAENS